MKFNLKKEFFYWLLCLVPFVFLAVVYKSMPASVPTHFGISGQANGWSSKGSLWFIPAGLSLFIYLLFLVIPKIDPKQRLSKQSGKFEHFRFITLLFITGIACFTIYISYKQSIAHLDRFLFSAIGLFFAALGNFFPTLKPNYFIGIRSPWALENEVVWKKTHQLAGKLWVVGGLLLALLPFLFSNYSFINGLFISIILIITLLPLAYSFVIWKQLKSGKQV